MHTSLCTNVPTSLRPYVQTSQRNSRAMCFLCLVKLHLSFLLILQGFSFILSPFALFISLFTSQPVSVRHVLIQYNTFSRLLFDVYSHFNALPLHFITYHVKTSYLADYGFIRWFVFISFFLCLVKLRSLSRKTLYFQFCGIFFDSLCLVR